jgi:carnosine N-methyltransferase
LEAIAPSCEVPPSERLGVSSGDFVEVYSRDDMKDHYDVVAMVFFIDTAKNVLEYFRTVVNCLKSGGLWLNLGPLKWHFEHKSEAKHAHDLDRDEDDPEGPMAPGGFELTEEDVLQLLEDFGFELLKYEEPQLRPSGYIHNTKGMETLMYYNSFWVARKK